LCEFFANSVGRFNKVIGPMYVGGP
jgi:hypothetical protein